MDTDSRNSAALQRMWFVWLLAAVWALMFLFVTIQYRHEKEMKARMLDMQLQYVNRRCADYIAQGRSVAEFFNEDNASLDSLRLTLLDLNGVVLYDSEEDAAEMGNHAMRPEISAAAERGHGTTIRRISQQNGTPYFYSALRTDSLIIRSALPYTISLAAVLRADRLMIWFMAVVTILMLFLAYYVLRQFARDRSALERSDEQCRVEHDAARREQREKIRIKRQLTNNINHELKTPVSCIHAYLETLMENPSMTPETQRSFLEKCFAQSERLRMLLRDISVITRMDEAGSLIERTELDLNPIILEVVTDLTPQAEAKGIALVWNDLKPLPMQGNASLLYSIFRNLADNAINYSGGTRAEIRLAEQTETEYRFTFRDNGEGVAAEHLPYLFERFYRVDKGRSRKAGGTGLGLAIVRNAVTFHGGRIEVRNVEPSGLGFEFTLKIRQ